MPADTEGLQIVMHFDLSHINIDSIGALAVK